MARRKVVTGYFGYYEIRKYPPPPPGGAEVIRLEDLKKQPGRLLAMRFASLKRARREDPSGPES